MVSVKMLSFYFLLVASLAFPVTHQLVAVPTTTMIQSTCSDGDVTECKVFNTSIKDFCNTHAAHSLCPRFCGHCRRALDCYSCQDIVDPTLCNKTVRCNSLNQVCIVAATITANFEDAFVLGCVDKSHCGKSGGRTSGQQRFCCNSDLCNKINPYIATTLSTTGQSSTLSTYSNIAISQITTYAGTMAGTRQIHSLPSSTMKTTSSVVSSPRLVSATVPPQLSTTNSNTVITSIASTRPTVQSKITHIGTSNRTILKMTIGPTNTTNSGTLAGTMQFYSPNSTINANVSVPISPTLVPTTTSSNTVNGTIGNAATKPPIQSKITQISTPDETTLNITMAPANTTNAMLVTSPTNNAATTPIMTAINQTKSISSSSNPLFTFVIKPITKINVSTPSSSSAGTIETTTHAINNTIASIYKVTSPSCKMSTSLSVNPSVSTATPSWMTTTFTSIINSTSLILLNSTGNSSAPAQLTVASSSTTPVLTNLTISSCNPNKICSFSPWIKATDPCSKPCGGGRQLFLRNICCSSKFSKNNDIAGCFKACNATPQDTYKYGWCNEVCDNGGTYVQSRHVCVCRPGYLGKCCDLSPAPIG